MTGLLIIAPGARTLVQDRGFRGARAIGVPPGGAMDGDALALLNALLGNGADDAALEAVLSAPTIEARGGPVRLALGGTLCGRIVAPDGKVRQLPPWRATTLPEGHRLQADPPARGGYGLIAVAGGIDVPPVLGSRSTCLRAGFGGFQGRALRAGDLLPVGRQAAPGLPDRAISRPPADGAGPVRVVAGPQSEWFAGGGFDRFLAESWRISPQSDRMGMRLEGPALAFASGRGGDIISDGIVPGAIQVPGNGLPILLLADAQTTGGYPKIATVIAADLARLSRLMPGDGIGFRAVTIAEAERLWRVRHAEVQAAIASIADLPPDGAGASDRLFAENLIGGMVDMHRPDHFDGNLETGGDGKMP